MMTQTRRIPMRRRRVALMYALALAAVSVVACRSQRGAPAADEQPNTAAAQALRDFQDRLQRYLDLRAEMARRLEPLSPTASAAELSARQEALAAALQTERKDAKQGDLIPPAAATQIAAIATADFKERTAAAELVAFSEVPDAPTPAINGTYPAEEALATVPALLLMNLPPLPDNLQYRFFGRHLMILDGDVQIIVDYIPNVLPPR